MPEKDLEWLLEYVGGKFTMTSIDAARYLYNEVVRVVKEGVPGDFVECGVWRGGSVMIIAKALRDMNVLDKKIWLYDTFSGMTTPDEVDVDVYDNRAIDTYCKGKMQEHEKLCWTGISLEDVRGYLEAFCKEIDFPMENLVFVVGDILETVPKNAPEQISVLRLDTDFYASTKHELEHLYSRLSSKGCFIADDYGHWKGARKALDDYFGASLKSMITKLDNSAIGFVKP